VPTCGDAMPVSDLTQFLTTFAQFLMALALVIAHGNRLGRLFKKT
jgi:hypothetical protein